jgi:hypothetical protein
MPSPAVSWAEQRRESTKLVGAPVAVRPCQEHHRLRQRRVDPWAHCYGNRHALRNKRTRSTVLVIDTTTCVLSMLSPATIPVILAGEYP